MLAARLATWYNRFRGDMAMTAPKILLTGRPGVGKTCAIRRTLSLLSGLQAVGFYTRELRGPVGRLGFEAVTLEGKKRTLAHVEFGGPERVSQYGVDVVGFEGEIVASIGPAAQSSANLVVIDEIGKMECFSMAFQDAVRQALDGPLPVLGTVAMRGSGFTAQVRSRSDVELIEVTVANRDDIPLQIARRLRKDIRTEQGAEQ